MGNVKLTQSEVERLLSMLKYSLDLEISFPKSGQEIEFEVEGEVNREMFVVGIFRGKINPFKYNVGARIKKNGTILLELHINPSNIHTNPNGEKIVGSHWHVYTEMYGRGLAFLATEIEDKKFVENTIAFLNKFNVIEKPKIQFQMTKTQ